MQTAGPAIAFPSPGAPTPAAPALPPAFRGFDAQRSFASVLGRAETRADADGEGVEGRAREAAENLVSIALVQPLLKQLRETGNAAPPFAPTQAERQFRALLDAELAQRMTRAANFPMVERLARDLLERAAGAPTAPAEA